MKDLFRIGLLLENPGLQALYKKLIIEQGYQVSAVLDCDDRDNIDAIIADAWVVVFDGDRENPVAEEWLKGLDVPVIFDDGQLVQESTWHRRVSSKLRQIPGMVNVASQRDVPDEVWVLAASTGGPAAVKLFLSELPLGLNVAFIYAQHIDQGFDVNLAQAISKGTKFPAVLAVNGALVANNQVLIIRPDEQAEVQANGSLVVNPKPWSGSYKPAINQIVANVASIYGAKSGVIVFTGMGNDGKAAVRLMRQQGGTVWAQTAPSCTVSSMPDEVRATGTVTFEGDPKALAAEFIARKQLKTT
ncbi:chemotaxis protein CheB [Simiduia litorea]|uniref:chemotaxis protein CheB n=1 Tax=Simiduia litorea TaxID=1435348 RepID=UPI0036F1CFBC